MVVTFLTIFLINVRGTTNMAQVQNGVPGTWILKTFFERTVSPILIFRCSCLFQYSYDRLLGKLCIAYSSLSQDIIIIFC